MSAVCCRLLFHGFAEPVRDRFALEYKNDESLHHRVHLLHDLEASLTLLMPSTRAFTFIDVPIDVDAVVGVDLLSMLAVQFVELLEQIVLQVGLNHVLIQGLLTLELLFVENFAKLTDLDQRDRQQRLKVLRN